MRTSRAGKKASGKASSTQDPDAKAHNTLVNATERNGGGMNRKMRVLVVDDHRDGADSLTRLLGESGYEVFVVYGGGKR